MSKVIEFFETVENMFGGISEDVGKTITRMKKDIAALDKDRAAISQDRNNLEKEKLDFQREKIEHEKEMLQKKKEDLKREEDAKNKDEPSQMENGVEEDIIKGFEDKPGKKKLDKKSNTVYWNDNGVVKSAPADKPDQVAEIKDEKLKTKLGWGKEVEKKD